MKYLVMGSGGREHAIAWRLLEDGSAKEVYVAPGNGGISDEYRCHVAVDDFEGIYTICRDKKIDIVIIGPEAPLVDGVVDFLEGKKVPVFGPSAKAAMLEGSKLFAKEIMERYGIPTAGHRDFTGKAELVEYLEGASEFPVVIKLDGLAAGKGVGIPETREEAIDFVNRNVTGTMKVFVEDFLYGEEASVLGISDGEAIIPLVSAQDHKRVFDGDRGPNTGGMGAYAPAPIVNEARLKRVHAEVLKPTIDGMRKEGIPFKGILYAGLIIKGDSLKVLEFNARFGDPETQVILPLLKGKLGDLIEGSIKGTLAGMKAEYKNQYAVTVVMASGGYPDHYEKGKEIRGLDKLVDEIILFHAGTKSDMGKYYTNGGRVLNVTAVGESFAAAREKVYGEIGKISFEGAQFRKDIGHRALKYFPQDNPVPLEKNNTGFR